MHLCRKDTVQREFVGVAEERRAYLSSQSITRNSQLSKELKERYGGRCQVCGFDPRDNYNCDLCESHHLQWISRGGRDELENLVLLCPNHLPADKDALERECALPLLRTAVEAAQAIATSKIIGLWVGNAEFGPRALGHRSLLARLDDIALRQRLSEAIDLIPNKSAAEIDVSS